MLQQILNDMHIDPELLAELDEEQKQILFCKMREEQVRRWKEKEDQLETEDDTKSNSESKKSSGKKVTFLVGLDGEPVVVVLGCGTSGEEVDNILQERARRQADLESDILKKAAEEELDKLVRLSRSTVEAMEEEATRTNTNKKWDPQREAVVRSLQEATVEMESQIQALEEAESRQQQKRQGNFPTLTITTPPATIIDNNNTPGSRPSSGSSSPSSGIGSMKSPLSSSPSSSLSSLSSTSSSSSSSSSLPPSPPAFSISSYSSNYNSVNKKMSGLSVWEVQGKTPSQDLTTVKPPILSPKPTQTQSTKPLAPPLAPSTSTSSSSPPQPVESSTNSTTSLAAPPSPPSSLSSTSSTISSSITPSPPPSLSCPSSPRFPSPLTIVEKDEEGIQLSSSHSSVVAAQIRRFEQLSEGSLEALKTATLERARRRRQREILEHLRSQVEAAQHLPLDTPSEGDHKAWQEQERKAKEAERRIREIARRAREEHRRAAYSMSPSTPPIHSPTSPNGNMLSFPTQHHPHSPISPSTHTLSSPAHAINANLNGYSIYHPTLINGDINGNIKSPTEDLSNNNNNNNRGVSGCVRQRVRPPKPPSRASIITWFREEELPKGAGLDPTRSLIAPWFHGIISRTEAEEVLSGAGIGCFLVRVSERIWGYAISYRGPDRCRHYLIDVTGGRYTFFGSHQAAHSSLSDLVEYHKHEVITMTGGELLTRPCGHPHPLSPDYRQLFTGTPYLPP